MALSLFAEYVVVVAVSAVVLSMILSDAVAVLQRASSVTAQASAFRKSRCWRYIEILH